MTSLFGEDGIATADDTFDFNTKSNELCSTFPSFADYFDGRLKDRLYDHVNQPHRRHIHDRLWTNNNCESMNHRFKIAVDWKPQQLPELLEQIYNVIRLHFADLKRSLIGNGNYELYGNFKSNKISQQVWYGNSKEENQILYKRFMNNKHFTDSMVNATSAKFAVPRTKRLAKKPGQRHRPKNSISENTAKILNSN